jgi:4-oxalocrotonate tautomerase
MPLITVEGPKIPEIERKRMLVERLTDAAVEVYGIAREHIIVLIRENLPENVGAGGRLIADRQRHDGSESESGE